ncbi:MAG: FAD-dependent oxidoreductase [Gemmatimonadota bacterium]
MNENDRQLGLDRQITRRDFLDGVAIALGGSLLAPQLLRAGTLQSGQDPVLRYPPSLTGLRGSHVGSFEALHALKDGRYWRTAPEPVASGEEYDLIVVGGGISGLAAAHFFRKARPGARILILDNHDDFGGHAKRNEFTYDGQLHIGYGGTQSIDSPAPYSQVAARLISELGIDVRSYPKVVDRSLYSSLGLRAGFFFERGRFGRDALVRGSWRSMDADFIAASPLSAVAKRDVARLLKDPFDPFPGLSSAKKKAKLARMSYADFLTKLWKVDPSVVAIFQVATHPLFGAGVDVVPAQDAFGLDMPGFQGMGLDETAGPGQNYDSIKLPGGAEDYYFHFPDGNASVARLLVRSLIPEAMPGSTADDVVTARANYEMLDRAGAPVRLRLSSPAMRVRQLGPSGAATGVEVAYLDKGVLRSARAGGAVLACWHQIIPLLCPELPAKQHAAMISATKVPLVYTNVLIRNWTAFERLGVSSITTPGLWHDSISLDFPVSIGAYHNPRKTDQPIVLHLAKSACKPGLPIREQHVAGRRELYTASFATIERHIRDDLRRVLGSGGFDPARDIVGLTVNRWPHGYAYQYNSLADDFWLNGGEQPCVVARQPFGRLAIANADAGAYSYTDAAIDQAHRAVQDVLGATT